MPLSGDPANWAAAGIAIVSAVVSFLSYRWARQTEDRVRFESRTQTFLTLRERFRDIKGGLPPSYDSPTWLPNDGTKEWRDLELYWQNAFDEWFVTNKLNPKHLQPLWTLFFERAVRSGLSHRPLRYVAWALTEGRSEFGGFGHDFRDALDRTYGGTIADEDFRMR